ncbi:MAG: extracellular solute-binding protein [Bacteroidia bacterium]|nr:MAG: extracellular solute-binding protein [Bacteroidia bacterium]
MLIVAIIIGLNGCGRQNSGKSRVIIFHAGSLSAPFKKIAGEYMKLNPGVTVQLEAAGSVECARKITELKKPCDIMASADYFIIDEMLIPEYASWNVKFASNSMVIAYTGKSRKGDIISSENWIEILLDEDIIYGRSDPDSDPCGYRTIMTLKLAEKYYERPGITQSFIVKDKNMLRPKEVDLLALLESNSIDYIFIYKSVALQHDLEWIELPREINLSDSILEEHYNSVSVEITGSKPGELIQVKGSTMVYGVTLLDNAPGRDKAIDFMKFLLGEPGLKIMKEMGQEMNTLPATRSLAELPAELFSLCIEEHY